MSAKRKRIEEGERYILVGTEKLQGRVTMRSKCPEAVPTRCQRKHIASKTHNSHICIQYPYK